MKRCRLYIKAQNELLTRHIELKKETGEALSFHKGEGTHETA